MTRYFYFYLSTPTVDSDYDTVKPSNETSKFQFRFHDHDHDHDHHHHHKFCKLSELDVGSEFDIVYNHKLGKKLFFDDVRGMLSVDKNLRHRTSENKKSVLVGRIVSKSEEEIKIIIRAKSKTNSYNIYDYLKVESCTKHCEFSMDKDKSGETSELLTKELSKYVFLVFPSE